MPSDVSTDREELFRRFQPLPDRATRNRRRLWTYMFWYAALSSILVAIAVAVCIALVLLILTRELGALMLAVFFASSPSTLAVTAAITWAVCFAAFASWYLTLARRPLLSELLVTLSATLVRPYELLQARSALREAVIAAGTAMPHLALITDDSVNAFVIAKSPDQAWIGVTTGLLERLSHDELRAVFAHLVARIRDGSALTNTVIASLFQAVMQSGRDGNALEPGDDGLAAVLLLARMPFVLVTYFAVRECLAITSLVILLGYRRAHAVTAHSADSEAMLLTRDPEGMLGALEKVLPVNNFPNAVCDSPLREDTLKALFFAWPPVNRTGDRELIRIRRLREVLGAAGANHR